jgi:hypothetical protein
LLAQTDELMNENGASSSRCSGTLSRGRSARPIEGSKLQC